MAAPYHFMGPQLRRRPSSPAKRYRTGSWNTYRDIYYCSTMVTCSSESEFRTPYYIFMLTFSQRASILSPSKSVDGVSSGTRSPLVLTFSMREQLLKNFSKGLIINSLRLLVAVSGLLSKEDHESFCGFLWQSCLTQAPCEIQTLVGPRSY